MGIAEREILDAQHAKEEELDKARAAYAAGERVFVTMHVNVALDLSKDNARTFEESFVREAVAEATKSARFFAQSALRRVGAVTEKT